MFDGTLRIESISPGILFAPLLFLDRPFLRALRTGVLVDPLGSKGSASMHHEKAPARCPPLEATVIFALDGAHRHIHCNVGVLGPPGHEFVPLGCY